MAFNQIRIRELPTWVKVLKKKNEDSIKILKEMNLIDDLLTLQKNKSLLTRKKGLRTQLETRIALEIGLPTQNLNRK